MSFLSESAETRYRDSDVDSMNLQGIPPGSVYTMVNMNRDHTTVSNYVSRLPASVLCLIFDWTPKDSVDIPVSGFGMICKSWRAIAVSYPKLWVHITLPFPNLYLTPDERDRKIESLQLFLHNFPHISTELTVIPRSLSLQPDPEDEILRNFSGRWTHLCLDRFTLVDKLTQPLPCLKSLSCHLPLTYHHSPSLPAAPELNHLQLTIMEPISFRPQNLMIPFHQITTLCLLEAPWLNLTEALQQFVNLRNLSITISRPYDWTATPLPKVTLQLTSFALIIQRPDVRAQYIVALLESLTLPVATRITLAKTTYGRSGPWRGDVVLKFLSESAATLTDLVLVAIPLGDGMLRKCLAATPGVQELTFGEVKEPMISGKSAGSQLLTALEVLDPAVNETILPELRSLTLEGMVSFYEPSNLIAMINSRLKIKGGSHPKAVTRLWNLTLRCSNPSPRWLVLVQPELPQGTELMTGVPSFLH